MKSFNLTRSLFICLLASFLLFSFTSCGSDDNDEPKSVVDDSALLIGKWYQSATWTERGGYEEETIDRKNWYITLTFEKNGTAVTEIREYDESATSTAKYTYDSKSRVIHFTTSNNQKLDAKVLELSATSLILEIQNKKIYYIH
jgi:hypothetical protein